MKRSVLVHYHVTITCILLGQAKEMKIVKIRRKDIDKNVKILIVIECKPHSWVTDIQVTSMLYNLL